MTVSYDINSKSHAPTAAVSLSWRERVGLLILLMLVLVASNWKAIGNVNFELGDFAANSLLVQDAKSLSLFIGNYSRVGFNHPGPAILYILTLGEVVFHDWLHIAKSPFSGQLMAVALYNAFWLVLIFESLFKILRAAAPAALAVSVMALALASMDFQIFNGIWFPHLYVFPFAAMLATGARLVDGHVDTLPGLGIASGFLINGHVSFIAILGIVLLVVLAANYRTQRGQPDRRILGGRFLAEQKRPLLRFLSIIVLFFVPLMIETVRHFPGPVHDYAAFSGHNKPNTLVQAVKYVGVYWGGTRFAAMLAIAFVGLLVAYARRAGGEVARTVVAIAAIGTGATLALLFYAKVGIDNLDFAYIGLFYDAVPALAVGIAAVCIYSAANLRSKATVALLLSLVFGVITWTRISKPVEYLSQYNEPGVPQLYDDLRKLPHQGRMVLDLDITKDHSFMWSSLLGVQAYAKRQHDEFFCINANWHISNTHKAQCSPDEVAHGQRYLVRRLAPGAATPAVQGMGMAIYPFQVPDMATLGEMTVADRPEVFKGFILDSGWSSVEGQFVWSEGPTPRLNLRVAAGFAGTAELDLGAFLPRPDADQVVTVEAGANRSGPYRFTANEQRQRVRVPISAGSDGLVTIVLHIDHPISPQAAGLSGDSRVLGVSLYGIKLEKR
jgi:hypothetical protein